MKKIEYVNHSMTENRYISRKLQFIEDKIKKLKEESEFRSWEIWSHKIVIENKRSLLANRSKESAAIREEIRQNEQELEKTCRPAQTEKGHKSLDVSILKNKILNQESRREAVDKANEKLSEEMECHKKKLRELANNLDDEVLYHYKRLSGSREGNPIAQVIGNACSGCAINVTAQTLNALKGSKELVLCPNCKRILFLSKDDQIWNGRSGR